MGEPGQIQRRLSLFDSTAIIVGIIIGVGFYGTSPFIAASAGGEMRTLAAWAIGGLMALVGAACYAELATTYPREGGEYVYLSRAFGPFWGFLFAWAGFWIIRPASIGALAIVFGRYAHELLPLTGHDAMLYGLISVVLLTVLNMLGVQSGKWTQNLLTILKVSGLLAVIAVALLFIAPGDSATIQQTTPAAGSPTNFSLALILVMWAYGGWNEMPSVAAEVRRPERNIPRALVLGTICVMGIYVLGTHAFFHALGNGPLTQSQAVATDVMRLRFPEWGAAFITALVALSCLGANNGMIFTSARVCYALGSEHRLYRWIGQWSPRTGTPLRALAAQGIVTLVLTAVIGRTSDGFERLVVFTGPIFWFFLLLTGVALFVLRVKDRGMTRPYRVTLYPVTPVVFILACVFMLYSSGTYAWSSLSSDAVITVVVMAVGVVMGLVDRREAGKRG